MLRFILRLLTAPFRTAVGRTARKAGGGLAAGASGEPDAAADAAPATGALSGGLEALLFTELARPRLDEGIAADLTIEEARQQVAQAERYFTFGFPLFPRGDFFYEEVEEEFLNSALGVGRESVDATFLTRMGEFRRVLNRNTRRLFMVYAPVMLGLSLVAGFVLARLEGGAVAARLFSPLGSGAAAAAAVIAAASVGALVALFLYAWAFKVIQQRNLFNLDNYITSKFARINQNFQVSKRRALNVERNMRMSQVSELKDEAGVWTLAYQWFAHRLLLCELVIRNRLFQVRRNTTLYWIGGVAIAAAVVVACSLAAGAVGLPGAAIAPVAGAGFIVVVYGMMAGTAPMMFAMLASNEWSRFSMLDLHQTVRDHVGEDKVQIVTFRDRNRLE